MWANHPQSPSRKDEQLRRIDIPQRRLKAEHSGSPLDNRMQDASPHTIHFLGALFEFGVGVIFGFLECRSLCDKVHIGRRLGCEDNLEESNINILSLWKVISERRGCAVVITYSQALSLLEKL